MPGGSRLGLLSLAGLCASACLSETNAGLEPGDHRLHFPAGLLLDPRVGTEPQGDCQADEECAAGSSCAAGQCRVRARWLFVSNANSDLAFNASSLVAVDIERVFETVRPGAGLPDLAGVGEGVDEDRPCRHLATEPQTAECHEAVFIEGGATVHMGHFASVVAGWNPDPGDDEAMLLVAVRGDPSVTWATLSGGGDGEDLRIDCGQGEGSGELDTRRCDDAHRMRWLRNDPDQGPIGAEPINLLVSPERGLAYVSHGADEDISLISLRGLTEPGGGATGPPAVVDRMLVLPNAGVFPGTLGLAERPCTPDDPDDPEDEPPPNATFDCERPLVYAGFRYDRRIISATVFQIVPGEDGAPADRVCVGPEELGTAGGIICDPQYHAEVIFSPGGISPYASGGAAQLGDLAFSLDGKTLYAVQSNPGGLLRVDTSVDATGNPRDIQAGAVEVCPRATAMTIYRDGTDELALVSCYRSGAVFVVDLRTLGVVADIQPGTGPHQMAVDLAREVVYIANTLEDTISIVDMSRDSTSRFGELARVGLQDPFGDE
jgi:DNA-binding beta-propeller fold protein YncE